MQRKDGSRDLSRRKKNTMHGHEMSNGDATTRTSIGFRGQSADEIRH
jgi:hypothetical protein